MIGRRAVVLLSGGLDSATTLAIAQGQGFACHALTIDYRQRHARELESARDVASALGVADHVVLQVDLRRFGGSALTGDIAVPVGRDPLALADVPVTYVPARNTVMLSLALAWAETLAAQDIFIGVNAVDYSGYPDCRPEYIAAFQTMANLATKASVEAGRPFRVHTPLLDMTKANIVRKAASLGVDFRLTWSCYDPQPDGRPCGRCDSCVLRRKGFAEAGVVDPV